MQSTLKIIRRQIIRSVSATTLLAVSLAALQTIAIVVYVFHRATLPHALGEPLPNWNVMWIGAVDVGFLAWNGLLLMTVICPGLAFAMSPTALTATSGTGKWNANLSHLFVSVMLGAVVTVAAAVLMEAILHHVPPCVGLLMFVSPAPVIVRVLRYNGLNVETACFAVQAFICGVTYAYLVVQTIEFALLNQSASQAQLFRDVAFGTMVLATSAMASMSLAHREWRPALAMAAFAVVGVALLNAGVYFAAPFALAAIK